MSSNLGSRLTRIERAIESQPEAARHPRGPIVGEWLADLLADWQPQWAIVETCWRKPSEVEFSDEFHPADRAARWLAEHGHDVTIQEPPGDSLRPTHQSPPLERQLEIVTGMHALADRVRAEPMRFLDVVDEMPDEARNWFNEVGLPILKARTATAGGH